MSTAMDAQELFDALAPGFETDNPVLSKIPERLARLGTEVMVNSYKADAAAIWYGYRDSLASSARKQYTASCDKLDNYVKALEAVFGVGIGFTEWAMDVGGDAALEKAPESVLKVVVDYDGPWPPA